MTRLLGMLGLCARARELVLGEAAAESLIRSGKCRLAFLDAGASKNAEKAMTNACKTYGVLLIALPEGELGRATGRPGRMAAATANESFASRMVELYRIHSGVQ